MRPRTAMSLARADAAARPESSAGALIASYQPPAGFSVSLSGDDGDDLHEYWDRLSAGGTVTMPLQKQVWGDEFGMRVDRFGVSWLVNIGQPQS